ncbi:Uncharacterised protein [Bordetella pertussis]|nr:Uncharacterised protein [Bordetella pertussis]CFW46045.1 Uncharacterised protein [Bordetella pertussis]
MSSGLRARSVSGSRPYWPADPGLRLCAKTSACEKIRSLSISSCAGSLTSTQIDFLPRLSA